MEGITIKKPFQTDHKYFSIATYALGVIILAILFEKILDNTGTLLNLLYTTFSAIRKIMTPFVIGFCIAYLFNPLVGFFENKLIGKISKINNGLRRTLSILVSYLCVVGCLIWILNVFVPAIYVNVTNFVRSLPTYLASFEVTVDYAIERYNIDTNIFNLEELSAYITKLFDPIMGMTSDIPSILQKVLTSTFIAASSILNFILGIFISFYMLYGKEHFLKEMKKILFAFITEAKASHFVGKLSRINQIFKSFIIGKTIDSFIIGVLCFLGLSLFNVPYVIIVSVIVGVTNMIPYFGPFIGAVPSVLIILLIAPSKALLVAIYIFILQQFDGMVLGPKILGESTGMNAIWIIFSIIVGGALAGPLGMFVGVPIIASIKLFFGETVDRKYSEKYYFDIPVTDSDERDSKNSHSKDS